jgi:DMSO reductase anchor subunit
VHPAFSVIFFTVASGAGFGLFALLYLVDALKLGGLGSKPLAVTGLFALVLIAAGLTSSLFHLANPKNAWRAFNRFRTSWLSREGVFAVAFYPFAMVYLGLTWFDIEGLNIVRLVFGAVATVLAWVTVFSTGMIYGCLKTIRQWNTPLVPANFLVLAHFSGALLLLVAVAITGSDVGFYLKLAGLFLAFSAALKAIYYFWIAEPGATSTINTATGFTRAQVKLLDAGHTHGTFLTQEFGFQLARRYAVGLKAFVFIGAFGVPLMVLMTAFGEFDLELAGTTAAVALLGLVTERWLFFAEARHVVNLYHGAQRC